MDNVRRIEHKPAAPRAMPGAIFLAPFAVTHDHINFRRRMLMVRILNAGRHQADTYHHVITNFQAVRPDDLRVRMAVLEFWPRGIGASVPR